MSRGQLEFIHDQGIPIRFLIDCGPGTPNSEAWDAKRLWPAIEIAGCEPQPQRYLILQEALYPGWLWKYGLSDKTKRGTLKVFGAELNAGLHWDRPCTLESEIMLVTLDWLMAARPDLSDAILWLDIEGSEKDVLCGATETLKRTTAVVVEVWPVVPCDGWCTAAEVADILSSAGFKKAKEFPTGCPTDPQHDEVWLR